VNKVAPVVVVCTLLALFTSFFVQEAKLLEAPSRGGEAEVTCAGEGCSGLDPYTTGCAASFYTLRSLDDSSGLLRVELEYSVLCGTKWTQAYWLDQVSRPLGANIIRRRGSDGGEEVFHYWSDGGGSWWVNTDQIWSPDNPADACAYAAQVGTGDAYPGVCVFEEW
jgi:hypothetical protein